MSDHQHVPRGTCIIRLIVFADAQAIAAAAAAAA